MPKVVRRVLAVLAGVGVAMGVILGLEGVSTALHRPPAGLDWQDVEAVRAFVASLPPSAFLFVLGGWILGTLAGGSVALRVARERPATYAGLIAALVGLGAVINLVNIPHPWWMILGAVLGIPLAAWLAVRWAPSASSPPRVG